MKKWLRLLVHPLLLAVLALAVVAILVWWVGPLVRIGALAPLETEWSRGLLIAVFVLPVAISALLRRRGARRASRLLTEGLGKSDSAPAATVTGPVAGERDRGVLGSRFTEAIAALRQMRLHAAGRKPGWRDWLSLSGGSYLYDLPWYVFIGAPGSGKTTALVHSGLGFPLADKFGPGAIRGVGGTRNCDWWFTDEAVLIDTAGRYTTQDSDQDEDKGAWQGFLALLKKSRPRRPLNGVFLTVGVDHLIGQSPAARTALAESIRSRLLELDVQLGTRLPVYVLVTKSDLLYGFSEYFADLGREQRTQVFGFTLAGGLAPTPSESAISSAFHREFGLLHKRLDDGLLERMQQETDGTKRAAIFGFPAQFGALAPALSELLDQVFASSRFAQPPWVRGVYFTSGTQEGSPIDRVMGSMARSFGMQGAVMPAQQGSGRSFFLTRLLREVVFPEHRLAGADLRHERSMHLLRAGGLCLLGACSVALAAGWAWSTIRNFDYLGTVDARVEPLRNALASLGSRPQDLATVAPVLQQLREVGETPSNRAGDPPLGMTLGLYQGDKIDAAAALAHQRALAEVFLPQLARRLEEQLRSAGKDNLEFSYEALKSYLMLYQGEHFDAEALKAWIALDWERNLDRGLQPAQRQAMEAQLDTAIAQGPPRALPAMDENLVRSVRALLASYPLEQRIFSRLKRLRLGSDIAAFSVAGAAGPSAPLVFERASGRPLTEGVQGLFTYDGYHKRFQQEVTVLTGVMAREEPWVLGQQRGTVERVREVAALGELTDRVRRLYLENYVREWEALLADVRLVKAGGLERSIETARILSGAGSPLANFLRAVVRETTLIPPDAERNIVNRATSTVRSTREGLENLFGGDPGRPAPSGKRIESIVDDRFAPLRSLVQASAPNQPAPIDDALKLFNEVYVYLTAVDTAVKSRSPVPPGDAAGRLRSEAGRLPEPVRSMVENLSQAGAAQARAAERGNLSQDLRPVTEFCRRAISGRYPLSTASARDVLPEDFGQMFGPGGLMDDFFQKRLAPIVDTGARPWRYKQDAEKGAITPAALAQFERAALIRDVFFRAGGRTPALRLDFRPADMDAGITQFILDVDGQLVKYAHGPVVPMAVQWPGPRGSNQVRLQVSPPSPGGGRSGDVVDGPWALFRLLDRARLEPGDAPEKFLATFDVEGRKARFEVTANSVQHPLRLREIREFSCPEGL